MLSFNQQQWLYVFLSASLLVMAWVLNSDISAVASVFTGILGLDFIIKEGPYA